MNRIGRPFRVLVKHGTYSTDVYKLDVLPNWTSYQKIRNNDINSVTHVLSWAAWSIWKLRGDQVSDRERCHH